MCIDELARPTPGVRAGTRVAEAGRGDRAAVANVTTDPSLASRMSRSWRLVVVIIASRADQREEANGGERDQARDVEPRSPAAVPIDDVGDHVSDLEGAQPDESRQHRATGKAAATAPAPMPTCMDPMS